MASLASSREIHEAFNFRVQIDGVHEDVHFQDVGPIESSVSLSVHKEAGSPLEIKAPNGVTFSDVTLTRAAGRSRALHAWYRQVLAALQGMREGRPIPKWYLRNVYINQLDRPKRSVKRYTLFDAFPIHILEGSWDNRNDEPTIESVTLTYRYYTMKSLSSEL